MSAWEKKPALETSGGSACLCCGTPTTAFEMDSRIAVGFGGAGVTKDGKDVWSENQSDDDAEVWTGAQAEAAASADPDHDWRIYLFAPLYDAVYQRHGEGQWVLIERGRGFA